jgi:hypothetical protein
MGSGLEIYVKSVDLATLYPRTAKGKTCYHLPISPRNRCKENRPDPNLSVVKKDPSVETII